MPFLKHARNVVETIVGFALCWVVSAAVGLLFGSVYLMLGHGLLGE